MRSRKQNILREEAIRGFKDMTLRRAYNEQAKKINRQPVLVHCVVLVSYRAKVPFQCSPPSLEDGGPLLRRWAFYDFEKFQIRHLCYVYAMYCLLILEAFF